MRSPPAPWWIEPPQIRFGDIPGNCSRTSRQLALTDTRRGRYIRVMAYSFLVFDFGANEDLAQQARQRLEGWKQAFRLDRKLLLKFDRSSPPEEVEAKGEATGETKGAKKSKKAEKAEKAEKVEKEEKAEAERIELLVRLDFSDHEKLSHHRWLERIPAETPFKDAQPRIVRQGEADFDAISKRFDELTEVRRYSRRANAPLGG